MSTNNKRRASAMTLTKAVTTLVMLADAVHTAYGKQFANWHRLGVALNTGVVSVTKLRKEFVANGGNWDSVKADVSKARTVAKCFRSWERAKRFGNLNRAYNARPKATKKRKASLSKRAERFVQTNGKASSLAWAKAIISAAK